MTVLKCKFEIVLFIGGSFGSLLGGLLYDTYGGARTFQAIGVAFFIAFILHMFIQHLLTTSSVGCKYCTSLPEHLSDQDINPFSIRLLCAPCYSHVSANIYLNNSLWFNFMGCS